MMQPFKTTLTIIWLLSATACQNSTGNPSSKKRHAAKIILNQNEATSASDGSLQPDTTIFKKHVQQLKKFAAANGYTTQYAMVIDLGLHSGTKRFFMVRLGDGKTLHAGLVTHGSSPTVLQPGERTYSNTIGSLCSSVGRYKIGTGYQGTFGLAYKLHGLESSNSNAFARAVVLHGHSCVPDQETDEAICQSWGCPTVSPSFLQTISSYIDKAAKPVLLEIYDGNK